MSDLLTKVRELTNRKTADVGAKYRDAVRSAAEGQEVQPEDVVRILDATGRTAEQFADDVQAHADRIELRQRVAAGSAAERAKAAAEKRIAELDAKLAAATAAIRAEAAPFWAAVRDADAAIAASGDATDRLFETCPDATLTARHAELCRAERDAEQAVADARDRLNTVQRQTELTPEKLGHDYRPQIAGAKARMPEAEGRVADAEQEVQRLRAERLATEDAMRSA